MKSKSGTPIQDVFSGDTNKDYHLFIFHVHGRNQQHGNIKWHLTPDCSVLETWKPGRNLGKVIMRDYRHIKETDSFICRTCLRNTTVSEEYEEKKIQWALEEAFNNLTGESLGSSLSNESSTLL